MTSEEMFDAKYKEVLLRRRSLEGTLSIDKAVDAATKIMNIFGYSTDISGTGKPIQHIMISFDNHVAVEYKFASYRHFYDQFSNSLNQALEDANKATSNLDKDDTNRMIEYLKKYCDFTENFNGSTKILSLKK